MQTRSQQDIGAWVGVKLMYDLPEGFEPLISSDVPTLEETVWGIPLDVPAQQQAMEHWMGDRVVFLDAYFLAL